MYNRIDGARNETYESYQRLPARWLEQMSVIESEISLIDAARKAAAERTKNKAKK